MLEKKDTTMIPLMPKMTSLRKSESGQFDRASSSSCSLSSKKEDLRKPKPKLAAKERRE
jgi:hypothetical protein